MKQNQHSRRTNEQARVKLANILLFEISDPDLALVTITGGEVSVAKSYLRADASRDAERHDETPTGEAARISRALEAAPATLSVEKDEFGYPVEPSAAEKDEG